MNQILEFILSRLIFLGFCSILGWALYENIKWLLEITFPKKSKVINTK